MVTFRIHIVGLLLPCIIVFNCSCGSSFDLDQPILEDAGQFDNAVSTPACALTTPSCNGANVAIKCAKGKPVREICEDGKTCFPGIGCVLCSPGQSRCDGEVSERCSADGSTWERGEVCAGKDGVHCDARSGECVNMCKIAAEQRDYLGCEYWPAALSNAIQVKNEFTFAVVLSNPQAVPARIQVTQGDTLVEERTIQASQIETIRLPASERAYRLRSNVPVSAYQFNPLEYQLDHDCKSEEYDNKVGDGVCYSFSNDASLLLPTAVLTGHYMIHAYNSLGYFEERRTTTGEPYYEDGIAVPRKFNKSYVASVAVVGVTDEPATVTVRSPAPISGNSGGKEVTFSVKAGDIVQLFSEPLAESQCDIGSVQKANIRCGEIPNEIPCVIERSYCAPTKERDFTGTTVEASRPVAVYSGSPCSFVPYNRHACDHLEEASLPLETWGNEHVVAITQPLRDEPNLVRILSAQDKNKVSFIPAVLPSQILNRGEWIELEAREDFFVKGTEPLSIAQYMVGQDYDGLQSVVDRAQTGTISLGDPSFTLVAPVEQYRNHYAFLAPETYKESWVVVAARKGQEVSLDGSPLEGFKDITGTEMQTLRKQIEPGAHEMNSKGKFGLQVYGLGSYTSYMYPAGLDLQLLVEIL